MSLVNKQIVLGVTGSIAAYKSPDLVRRLKEAGALVRVVMTEHAKRFITPLTMQAVSANPVRDDLFDLEAEAAMGHIELARWADMVLIAPASANCMSRLAEGRADDLLSTICLATEAPVLIAPAMNQQMWQAVSTQNNRQRLQDQGIVFFGPAAGDQACGEVGPGRMVEPCELVELMKEYLSGGELQGLRMMLTAGPTREAIDPVRYISNASSGKMGYALAEAARDAGATVTLISGPVSLPHPKNINLVSVTTAQEMHDAVMAEVTEHDIFIGVAAVADYRVKQTSEHKLAKSNQGIDLALEPNVDIIASVGRLDERPFIVGFAAETENLLEKAEAKRQHKLMNLIVANQVGKDKAMYSDTNEVYVLGEQLKQHFPLTAKTILAKQIIKLIAQQYRIDYDRKNNAA